MTAATSDQPPEPKAQAVEASEGQRSWWGIGASFAVAAVTAFTVLQRLDVVLDRMQRPASAASSATALGSPTVLMDLTGAVRAAQAWVGWDSSPARPPGWTAMTTLALYVAVDVVLALSIFGLLWLGQQRVVAAARARALRHDSAVRTRTDDVADLASIVVPAAATYVLLDVGEDATLLVLAHGPQELTARVLGLLSLGKWLALAAVSGRCCSSP